MTFIDTNIVLRWLLNDHPEQNLQVRALVDVSEDELLITDVVLAEIYYVLCRRKQLSNRQVAAIFGILLEQPAFIFDQESRLNLLITVIRETMLDFADCYLISRAIFAGQPLQTFDKAMLKAYDKYAREV